MRARRWLRTAIASERGATAVEYAIMASLIGAVVAGIVLTIGQHVLRMFGLLDGAF
ncbi:MAG: Flp family type IVb pilin [Actinomycetota bacterium]|nr:Flp family type IVb pilin [Actinomycetota bacterium]